jgi:hypothetical protein
MFLNEYERRVAAAAAVREAARMERKAKLTPSMTPLAQLSRGLPPLSNKPPERKYFDRSEFDPVDIFSRAVTVSDDHLFERPAELSQDQKDAIDAMLARVEADKAGQTPLPPIPENLPPATRKMIEQLRAPAVTPPPEPPRRQPGTAHWPLRAHPLARFGR